MNLFVLPSLLLAAGLLIIVQFYRPGIGINGFCKASSLLVIRYTSLVYNQ
ncbi:hypothetical protein GO755_22440 [Spirosoma sp. HMF4905]|uniref:Uncharacterized protein n=1 Tax=Spirosoma arboris TaxID=2682092 RepID=A0A7K1SG68_9BACT|nr:hypothetical protein [Spirosoma arboris]MVM32817.1 hypothetical protein [Spirosoma arboris]